MTANALLHKTKPWSQVLHHWQIRLLSFLTSWNGRILHDPRFPSLAIVFADSDIDESEYEHAFRNSPEEIENVELHIFPDCPDDVDISVLFDTIASVLKITPT